MTEKTITLFDKRIVARNLKHGRISPREYESFVGHLPDATGKAEHLREDRTEARNKKRETGPGAEE